MAWVAIPRPRLFTCFREQAPLTFLYGLPGSGKTQLLKEWTESRGIAAAWLTCTDADTDPVCFWQHLIQALGAPINALPFTASPFPSNLEAALLGLVAWMKAQQQPIHLIVDDYHLIRSEVSQKMLPRLFQMRPDNLSLYITSRFREVQLPLHRWMLSGQLALVTPADLAFTLEETQQALHASGVPFTETAIQAVHRYTNGWIAGVQLALLRVSKDFPGGAPALHDPQQVAHALCADVFSVLPQEDRTFLTQTAFLDVVTADVCAAVSGQAQCQALLESLAEYGLLVSLESDRRAFRYLDFWKDFLRTQGAPGDELHRRAAVWYRSANDQERAISHALQGDMLLAAELILAAGPGKIARGELVTLRRWLEGLPETIVQADSQLSMLYAWALVHAGGLDQAERYLHHPGHSPGELYAVRARIAAFRGDKRALIHCSEKALQSLPDTAFSLRADMLLNLGCAYLEEGAVVQAQRTLMDALRLSRTAQQARAAVFTWYFLGKVSVAQGRLQQALMQYQAGLKAHSDLSVAGVLHVGMAEIAYEHNDLEDARRHLEDAFRLGEQGGELKPLVYAQIAFGQLLASQEAVQRLEQAASLTNWTLLYAWQALWWLRAGNISMASYWLEDTRAHSGYLSEFERLVQARILLTLEHWEDAGQLLDSLQANAVENQRHGDVIRILLLQAQRYKAQGKQQAALHAVAEALERGEQEGYVRAFLDEGEPVYQLCMRLMQQQPGNHYLKRMVQHFTKMTMQPVHLPFGETLSQREVDVLLLLAEGASNEEIAKQLVLTTGTVKWHVHNIFGKLESKNRTQVVKKARALGLLSA